MFHKKEAEISGKMRIDIDVSLCYTGYVGRFPEGGRLFAQDMAASSLRQPQQLRQHSQGEEQDKQVEHSISSFAMAPWYPGPDFGFLSVRLHCKALLVQ